MVRPRLLLALLVVTAICVSQAAYAKTDYQWDPVVDYDCYNCPERPGYGTVPCLVHDYDWDYAINGAYIYELYGDPPIGNDPDVSQTITNYTQKTWTDWHADIVNGYFVVGSVSVYNIGVPDPAWTIGYTLVPGYTDRASGFFAQVVPQQGTQIDFLDKLSVFFTYELDGSGQQVSINQYPTDTAPIPEPASFAALLTGVAAFGFGIRRRAR